MSTTVLVGAAQAARLLQSFFDRTGYDSAGLSAAAGVS